jgi:DNA-binding transcriptional regulator YhcF (GntR family)
MALLAQNDVLFAHKALNIVPDLSACARRVAGAIIDHFNKRTGQCDPSVERLARMLGIHEQTVKKATCELCEAGLINKVMHGGKMHRSKFEPQWARFQEIVADWDAAMKSGNPLGQGSKTATLEVIEGSETATFEGSETATQTLRSNQSKEPFEGNAAENSGRKPQAIGVAGRQKGVWKKGSEPPRQRHMLLPIAGGNPATHSQAARAAADKRLFADMRGLGSAAMADCLDRITPQISEAAALAEMKRHGAGLPFVLEALQLERMRAHG